MSDNTPRMPTQADVAERAHQIYERRKWEHGYDVSDWVLAEQELHQEFWDAMKAMKAGESEKPDSETKTRTTSA